MLRGNLYGHGGVILIAIICRLRERNLLTPWLSIPGVFYQVDDCAVNRNPLKATLPIRGQITWN